MLFNLPTRDEPTVDDIIRKAHTKKEFKPKIKVKGGTLSDKVKAICDKVKQNLGDVQYRLITKDEEFIDYCKKAIGAEFVSLDTETDGVDTMRVNLVGVCIKSTNQDSVYVPVGHISAITEELLDNQVSKQAIHDGLQLLIDNNTKFVFHNAYFDIVLLHNQVNVDIKAWFDTLIGAQLLNENEPHGLKQLYAKYCANTDEYHKFGELFDGIPISYIPPQIAGYYGQFDTVQTEALCRFQLPFLTVGTEECKEYNLELVAKLFWEDEMPLVEVLVDMKLTGIGFDFKQAEVLKKKYTKLMLEAEKKFNKAVEPIESNIERYNFIHKDKPIPIPVNYNSPDQLKALFYDICGLPKDFYRKKPGTTGKEVREAILVSDKLKNKPIYKIVETLDEVKMYDKAIHSFVEKLTEDAIEHGGKIHCDLKQYITDTGRISCTSPNLQQCPSKLGDIRTMFKADDGYVFVNCDFSKQEPCVLASSCQDPKLIEVFHSGLDIYGKIASMMFELPYEECLEFYPDGTTNHDGKKRRSIAKKVVLSVMYSKGTKSLAEDIHSTIEKAQEIYDNVLTAYPTMASWMEKTIADAYRDGHVDNLFGRRRRLPDLLLPKFDIDVPSDEAHVIDFYKKFFTDKLNKVWKDSDVKKIKDEAREYGIFITDNRKKIAESYRKIINFCIQGCIMGDSLITTQEHGLTKISDVVYEDVHVWDGESFVKASCLPSGKKELMRITFYDGRTIDCSPTHKFLFKNVAGKESWKTAKELYDMGDKQVRMITISNEVDDFNVISDTDFPELDKTNIHNAHSYNFNCIKDSYELGYVLGWLHCDGSVIRDRNCCWLFAENKLNILSTVESILSKYFNYTVNTESVEQIKQQKKGMNITQSLTRLVIYSKTLANQALAMGIKHHIPNVIFKSKRAMLGFIQACFDSDGSISAGHGPYFTLGKGHYYEQFAKEFQQILSLFGFASRLNYCKDRINVIIMKRDAEKFNEVIGFRHVSKHNKLVTVHKTLKHSAYLNTTRIKTIKYLNEQVEMFDIVNSESHKFVVNGVVTHNSAAVITKRAMRNIFNNDRLRELGVKLILSIHDESMCLIPKDHAYEACQIIEQCSIDAGKGLPVGLSCDLAITENWYGQEFMFDENHKLIPKPNHD